MKRIVLLLLIICSCVFAYAQIGKTIINQYEESDVFLKDSCEYIYYNKRILIIKYWDYYNKYGFNRPTTYKFTNTYTKKVKYTYKDKNKDKIKKSEDDSIHCTYYFTPYKMIYRGKPVYKIKFKINYAQGSWLRRLSQGPHTVALTFWNNYECDEPLLDPNEKEGTTEEYTILIKNVKNILHNTMTVYIPAEVLNNSRIKYLQENEEKKEHKFYLEARFFEGKGEAQDLNEQNLIVWSRPKYQYQKWRKRYEYGPAWDYPISGDGICKHFFNIRRKGDVESENTQMMGGDCQFLEKHDYKEIIECFNCAKPYDTEQEHDEFLVANPDASKDCNLMTFSKENEGFIGNYEIYVENQKGEKKLLEKRTRGSKDNRDDMCPLHNMVLKDENHYVCTKCNIERYGGEPLMSPEPNPHIVEISKCVEPQITIDINGLNVTLRRAANEGSGEALYLAETETTEQMWMAMYPNHLWNFNRDSKVALDYVTYEDAMMFISMLNKMSEDKDWNLRFFLPTVEEWVMAYHLGGVVSDGWQANNSGGFPHRVGEKPANSLKVYDMKGNVAEMCEEALSLDECDDTYDIYYKYTYEDSRRNHFNAYSGTGYLDEPYEKGPTDVRVINLSTGKPQIGFRIFAVPK